MNRTLYIIRQAAYTLFAFCYFLYLALYLTIVGFYYIVLRGNTEKSKLKYHQVLQRQTRFVINHVPGTQFDYDNHVGETFDKPAVIICNHQSHLDLMAIMMLTPRLIILTKSWVWHNPFYGLVIRFADYLPISDNETMMKKISDRVKNGYSVVVFPEGTRSVDCQIGRFHRGAFKMAEDLGLDIVPVFIHNFGKVLPKTSWHLHPGRMSLEVLPRFERTNEEWQNGGYRSVTRTMHKAYLKKSEEVRNNR